MNARTLRAIELSVAAFELVRHTPSVLTRCDVTGDFTLLWTEDGGALSAWVSTEGRRVRLEVWKSRRVLAVSRITGASDCRVEEFNRGDWEQTLMRLASRMHAKPGPPHSISRAPAP